MYVVILFTCVVFCTRCFCFFKQKTAYEMRISDWSSDVCSSDLEERLVGRAGGRLASVVGGDVAGLRVVMQQEGATAEAGGLRLHQAQQIGRASCRERVCQYV